MIGVVGLVLTPSDAAFASFKLFPRAAAALVSPVGVVALLGGRAFACIRGTGEADLVSKGNVWLRSAEWGESTVTSGGAVRTGEVDSTDGGRGRDPPEPDRPCSTTGRSRSRPGRNGVPGREMGVPVTGGRKGERAEALDGGAGGASVLIFSNLDSRAETDPIEDSSLPSCWLAICAARTRCTGPAKQNCFRSGCPLQVEVFLKCSCHQPHSRNIAAL